MGNLCSASDPVTRMSSISSTDAVMTVPKATKVRRDTKVTNNSSEKIYFVFPYARRVAVYPIDLFSSGRFHKYLQPDGEPIMQGDWGFGCLMTLQETHVRLYDKGAGCSEVVEVDGLCFDIAHDDDNNTCVVVTNVV